MAGKLSVNPVQINDSATATNNFVLKADNLGGVKLSRGNDGATTQDILTIGIDGKVAIKEGIAQSVLTSGTPVTLTNQTSVDFTGIPSWAKRITVMFNGVSTNGASNHVIKLGTSGGIESTGYSGAFVGATAGGASAGTTETTGFLCGVGSSAGNAFYGTVVLTNLSNNLWSCAGGLCISLGPFSGTTAGAKSLSGTLDRIRLTTINGTDQFDAGTINIMWE